MARHSKRKCRRASARSNVDLDSFRWPRWVIAGAETSRVGIEPLEPCPGCHGPIDNRDGCAECGLYIEKRRIEQVRVIGFVEAAIGIEHVAGIPLFYLVIEGVAVNHLAARFELPCPTLHA